MLHKFSFPRTNLLVLTIADKLGHEQVDGWVMPLKERFGERIAIAGIADVRGVPGLWHSSIREKFQKLRSHPVMLDWDGQVIQLLPVEKHCATVYVLSLSGLVLFQTSGDVKTGSLSALLAAVERGLTPTTR